MSVCEGEGQESACSWATQSLAALMGCFYFADCLGSFPRKRLDAQGPYIYLSAWRSSKNLMSSEWDGY